MAQKSASNDQTRATTEDPYAGPLRAQFRSGLAPAHSAVRTAKGNQQGVVCPPPRGLFEHGGVTHTGPGQRAFADDSSKPLSEMWSCLLYTSDAADE